MDNKDEIILVATKALDNLRLVANESENKIISATYVKYTTELALAKIQELKQQGR